MTEVSQSVDLRRPLQEEAVEAIVPVVRPFRVSRLLFSYLPPLIPFVVAWDGTVSALRAYTPEELLAIARTVPGGSRYEWRAERTGRALYLTGIPT